jgi:predicted transglutaminase-like cysteine proteinase
MLGTRGKSLLAAGLLACGILGVAPAQAATAGIVNATYAAVGQVTSVPYGWVGFCQRYAGECNHGTLEPVDINLNAKTLTEITRINLWVNKTIQPVSDWDHWHVADQWDYPMDGKGDCEDYALLKRRLLIARGFPRQALLMTVVKDEHNEGHAVLTVKTNHGEYILDNLTDKIKPWAQTPYHFVKRQSQSNEMVWLRIGPPTQAPAYVSRGTSVTH